MGELTGALLLLNVLYLDLYPYIRRTSGTRSILELESCDIYILQLFLPWVGITYSKLGLAYRWPADKIFLLMEVKRSLGGIDSRRCRGVPCLLEVAS